MPHFDFSRRVGRKIALQKFRRSVVLMVVDVADFDGSLPRQAIRYACRGWVGGWVRMCEYVDLVGGGHRSWGGPVAGPGFPVKVSGLALGQLPQAHRPSLHLRCSTPFQLRNRLPTGPAGRRSLLPLEALERDPTRSLPRNFRLVVAVNKSDLLPNQVTPTRLEVCARVAGLGGAWAAVGPAGRTCFAELFLAHVGCSGPGCVVAPGCSGASGSGQQSDASALSLGLAGRLEWVQPFWAPSVHGTHST